MPATTTSTTADAKRPAGVNGDAAEEARILASDIETSLSDIAKRAERVFQDGVGQLKIQAREKLGVTSEHLDTARHYVVERVQERPFTTTVAALGAGFLLGLLFAGNRR